MIFTNIGGYGHTEESFIKELREKSVDLFVDVRQRRGMRGASYSFLNSLRLQSLLKSLKIDYLYLPEFSPSADLRNVQKKWDVELGSSKRSRSRLSQDFIERYKSEILGAVDKEYFKVKFHGACVVAFFCVELDACACHRSLVEDFFQ